MKFYPPKGKETEHIGLTTGHAVLIEKNGTDIDTRFHREAIARGCRPHGIAEVEEDEDAGFDRKEHLVSAIAGMVEQAEPTFFTADGKPQLRTLSERAGFSVTASERDAAWEAFTGGDATHEFV